MSQIVPQSGGSTAVMTCASSNSTYSFASSASSSFSASSSSTTSSSTKVMKQSTTSTKSSSSSSSSASRSSAVNVRSSGMSYADRIAGDLGIDVGKEMERLKLRMTDEMANIHRDMFRLMPGSPDAPPAAPLIPLESAGSAPAVDGGGFLVKLDDQAVRSCIDKAHDDRVKLNFDVQEYDSETINIKTVGNKIEVHATKKSKKGDEERSEEFSRVYELPTEKDVDPSNVTSSIYQDGVLTIELPVADALRPAQSQ